MAGKFKNSIITTVNPRYSVNFDGTGDYISAPGSSSFAFGTGNFTVEFWLFCNIPWASQTNPGIVGQKENDPSPGWQIYRNSGSNDMYARIVSSNDYGSAATPATQVWEHWALVRSGSNLTWYRNGTATFTHTGFSQNITDTTGLLYIGYTQVWGGYLNAIISNLRIVKGTAVYTGTFAVPTSPLSRIQSSGTNIAALTGTETVLLTCQDSTIKDNSASPVTFTVNGDTSVTGLNPFSSGNIPTTTISGRFNKNDILYAIQDNNWKGYTSLDVDVLCVGGGGGVGGYDGIPGSAGGAGATIIGRVNVPSSKTLTVIAGGGGAGGTSGTGAAGGTGGLPGGGQGGTSGGSGSSGSGGGGGGWSGIFDTSYSVYFDGSGDYLRADAALDTITSNSQSWTVECWVYPLIAGATAAASDDYFIGMNRNSTGANEFLIGLQNIYVSTDAYDLNSIIGVGQWTHVAAVYNGSSLKIYINGVLSNTVNVIVPPLNVCVFGIGCEFDAGSGGSPSNYFTGYISNLRFADTEIYTGNFTVPTQPLAARGVASANVNALVSANTRLLTCQSSTIIDNGPNAFTITVNGDAVVATNAGALVSYSNTEPFVRYFVAGGGSGGGGGNEGVQNDVSIAGGGIQWNGANSTSILGGVGTNYPGDGGGTGGGGGGVYGGAGQSLPTGLSSGGGNYINPSYAVNSYFSNYFDGSGDYLSVPTNTVFDFGTGDFTLEAWIYRTALPENSFIISASGSGGLFWGFATGGDIGWGRTSVAWDYQFAGNIVANRWYHVALTRSGTNMRMFINGTQLGSTQTNSTSYNISTTSLNIGSQGANYYFAGYISNAHVVKGAALYTSNFTPPTAPLTAISGTSLLTCKSSTFIDKSTNNFTITRNGDVIVREIHPFNIPTGNAELGGGIGISTGVVSMPANVSFFGYTSAGSGGMGGRSAYRGANGTVVIRYTGFQKAIGGAVDYDNGYTIHTYDSPGTFIVQ
jgi:hypothetical protein